jgi:hypothetical protein
MTHQEALSSLEQATTWRKSSYSEAANNCVEITDELPGWIGMRDSKLGPDSPILVFTHAEWAAFTAAVHSNEF